MNETDTEIHLKELVDRHEKKRENPLRYRDFSREMIHNYVQELQGLRLHIYRIEATNKLSQNRNEEDHQAIVADLAKSSLSNEQQIAHERHGKPNRGVCTKSFGGRDGASPLPPAGIVVRNSCVSNAAMAFAWCGSRQVHRRGGLWLH
jgi:hypothetical protein